MKKAALMLLCFGISLATFAGSFGKKDYRIGGCLYYASEIKSVGIGLSGSYIFSDIIEGGASVSYVLKNDYRYWAVADLDAHYLFYEYDRNFRIYAMGGFSGIYWNYNKPAETILTGNPLNPQYTVPEKKDSGFDIGFNIGAGANYSLSDELLFLPEFKFTISEDSFIRLVLTLQYSF